MRRGYNVVAMNDPGPAAAVPNWSMVAQCHAAALDLFRNNLGRHGILAARPVPRARDRNYHAVFARDAAICALAMVRCADAALVAGARLSLSTLALHQADNGQIPKFVLPGAGDGDFWYVGCIDATLWWLIAVKHYVRVSGDTGFEGELAPRVALALNWLVCQEHPGMKLLTQNEASDWADIMPRSGFVLYSNALWYYVKRLYGLPALQETRRYCNQLLHPSATEHSDLRRLRLLTHFVQRGARNRDLYLSFVNFSFWGEEGDVCGNLLAVLTGLASETRARAVVHALEAAGIGRPVPARATLVPIEPGSNRWRGYMGRHRQNLAYQYHNGGCWPLLGGFRVMALARLGMRREASEALVALAAVNARGNWEFNEWFHGITGEAAGMPGQSWNAAAFLLAEASLHGTIF